MRKKVYIRIKGKRFGNKTLVNILNEIYKIYNKFESDNKDFLITLNCINYETLEINHVDFNEKINNILDIKKLGQILVKCVDYKKNNKKEIKLCLTENGDVFSSFIEIVGDDLDWVYSIEKKLNELLDAVEPIKFYYEKYSSLILTIIIMSIGFFCLNLMVLVLNTNYQTFSVYILKFQNLDKLLQFNIIVLLSWLIGFIGSIFFPFLEKINQKFSRAFPSIEFDFGPIHLRKSRKIRNYLKLTFLYIILPIFLGLFLRLI